MDSLEEKRLFEDHGWEYDYISREWKAPDGTKISTDALVTNMEFYGVMAEETLKGLIVQHGIKDQSRR